jgi:hypothetical protein
MHSDISKAQVLWSNAIQDPLPEKFHYLEVRVYFLNAAREQWAMPYSQ